MEHQGRTRKTHAEPEGKSAAPAFPTAVPARAHPLLQLQRTIGNQAVARLVFDDVLRSPGEPLDLDTRAFMESRFGHDFSQVRVHTGSRAAESARSLDALAYTVGQDIVFGAGHFAPGAADGRRLLAHELAHVVQQSGRAGAMSSDAALESGASQAAATVAGGRATNDVGGASAARIARQPQTPQIPAVLSFLTPADVVKLRAFGDADFQNSLNTLQAHLRKTKGFTAAGDPQQYIDIRQASGELRTFLDYVRNPEVNAIKVVPSASGGRSPDLYVRYRSGEGRVEIYNITLAARDVRPDVQLDPQGRQVTRIPKAENESGQGTHVELPVKEFDVAAVRDAIRSKIKTSTSRPSQLDAQNPNTRVAGRQMTSGGDVVIQITHGAVPQARVDQIIRDLEPELLASSARRVVISGVDANDPRGGRKVFEYTREGDRYVGAVRTPYYKQAGGPGPETVTPALTTASQGGRAPYLKTVGGFIFHTLVSLAIAYIIEKLRQRIERGQVEDAVKKLEPQIAEKLSGLSRDIVERQSASEQPLFASIKYSLSYMHPVRDRAGDQLAFTDTEHGVEEQKMVQDLRTAELAPIFAGAQLSDVTIVGGEKPPNQESFARSTDKHGVYETYSYTFTTSVALQRISNPDLRDYVLSQWAAGVAEGRDPARMEALQGRLGRLQAAVAKEEAHQRADEERQRQAEEKRKQEKLAAARAAPKPAGQSLLVPPGPATARPLSAEHDPFNLAGRATPKSGLEQAADAADIAEALKTELVQKANALKGGDAPRERLEKHRAEVETWIRDLRAALQQWRTKGSPEWPGVKRMEYLSWWVDQPEGRAALFR